MQNEKIILVPNDFSDVCDNAITYGAKLAELFKFDLAILHIADKKTKALLKKENKDIKEVSVKLNKISEETEKKYGIKVGAILEEGDIFKDIGKIAAKIKASLMILGTHGKVGLKQKLGVSYAKRVISTVPVPVIVVHNKTNFINAFNNFIFPVNTTAEVRQKVEWSVAIAKNLKSKIHLFQLYQNADEDKKKMEKYMGQIIREFDKNNIKYVHVIADPKINFAKQVQNYANNYKAELITIMITADPFNFKFGAYEEKMIFNPYEIPVMCINTIQTKIENWQ